MKLFTAEFILRLGVWCLAWCFSTALFSQSRDEVFPKRPEPAVYVHDYSGWLTPSEKSALEYRLRRYWDSTSTQIVVMIRPDIGDYDKQQYATELIHRWGIGSKEKDNGVVMLVKSEQPERGVFIATGYGVEGALPDIVCAQIIRNDILPRFREQKYAEGINAGITSMISSLSGEYSRGGDESSSDNTAFWILFFVFGTIIALFLFIAWQAKRRGNWYTHDGGPLDNPSKRDVFRRRRGDDGSSGSGGGWWIGGGGWGGGSDWGGGGGSWGGGSFGGGDSGGGGAGGDW